MTAPSPAAELRAAASRVRELASGETRPYPEEHVVEEPFAEPLAELFDAAAIDEENHNASGATRSAFTDYALALARVLLGGAS